MNWRLANSLITLRSQLDAAFPNRSKISDGSIGDAAHAARKSDHDPNSAGVVTAIDVTNDLAPKSLSGQRLVNALYDSKDKRIKYLIFNHRITISPIGSGWKPYRGINAHEHHVHISVASDAKLYDDGKSWLLDFTVNPIPNPDKPLDPANNIPPAAVLVQMGSRGDDVRLIQHRLADLKFLGKDDCDGVFGAKTAAAVRDFQVAAGIPADSIVGTVTRQKLFQNSN